MNPTADDQLREDIILSIGSGSEKAKDLWKIWILDSGVTKP